ncbi:hypothetical protein OIV83_002433 [Microbotryomycetes sp. JL201]|nr:hypothetical protein OIV83_002433 [Microbotryomycetes sp. JL201]
MQDGHNVAAAHPSSGVTATRDDDSGPQIASATSDEAPHEQTRDNETRDTENQATTRDDGHRVEPAGRGDDGEQDTPLQDASKDRLSTTMPSDAAEPSTSDKVPAQAARDPSEAGSPPVANGTSATDGNAKALTTSLDAAEDATSIAKPASTHTLEVKGSTSRTASPAPPGPSISPAPAKKFQSSLAVNKKFLEKAADKSKPEIKTPTTARLATPPIAAPVSTSHPRLLTGKISSVAPSASQASQGQPTAAPTGWRAPVSDAGLPRPTPQRPGEPTAFSRDGFGSTLSTKGSGPVWGRKGDASGRSGGWSGGDFPTAAEAAKAKDARARALAEQMEAKEKALQARAAANAHLLEQLDAFRGKHLDPNAAHWDEDDDDFLDDTIEFGDGTQYKVSEVEAAKLAASASEEHDEAPEATSAKAGEETTRAERFKDDYDRTWRTAAGGAAESRTLYNDRLGRLETYAEKRDKGAQGPVRIAGSQRPESDRARRPSTGAATAKPEAKPPAVNPWNKLPPAQTPATARRPSVDLGVKKPSIDSAGRQLPPHMAAAAASVKSPPRGAPLSVLSPPKASSAPLAPAPSEQSGDTKPQEAPTEDIETVHAREMHAAAERAKKRREEEERQRLEQVERARKKAAELEEKQKKAEEEAAKQKGAAASAKAADADKTTKMQSADQAESWRRRPSVTSPPASSGQIPAKQVEPMRILAREPSTEATKMSVASQETGAVRRQSDAKLQATTGRGRVSSAGSKPGDATAAQFPTSQPIPKERKSRNSVSKTEPAAAPARSSNAQQQASADERLAPSSHQRKRELEPSEPAPADGGAKKSTSPASRPAAQTKQPASQSLPVGAPAVKIPSSTEQSVAADASVPGETPSVKLPRARLAPAAHTEAPRGRQESRKSSRAQTQAMQPKFESREPLAQFDRSREARSPSPPPAWRMFAIRLAAISRPRRPTPIGKAKAFADPFQPSAVRPMSFEPPLKFLGPNLSRDEMLLSKPYYKGGKLNVAVRIPRRRIRRKSEIAWADVPRDTINVREAAPVRLSSVPEHKSVDYLDDGLDATTAPTAAALFDLSPERPSREAVRQRALVPSGDSEPRSRLVTSELDGEIVKTSSKEALTAPGADPTYQTSATPPPTDRSQSHSAAMTPTSAVNWSSKAPMSLAVLDPISMSVWSATPGESPARSRSISHNAIKPENSLHGLADDDFPAAVMPTSLAELKTEDEVSNEVLSDSGAHNKDEARLRAAAPSFATFNPLAGSFEHSTASTAGVSSAYDYAGSRQESPVGVAYPTLSQPTLGQHSGYAQSTSPMMVHASAAAYSQPTSAYSYTTLTSSAGQTNSAAQHHSYYPSAAAAVYQSPIMSAQQVTAHPSTYASYGAAYGAGAYGAVGAIGQRGVAQNASSYGRIMNAGYRDVSAGPYGTQYHQQMAYRFAQPRPVQSASFTRQGAGGNAGHQSQASVDSNRYGSVSPVIMPQSLPPPTLAPTLSSTASAGGSSPGTPTSATAPINAPGPALYGVQQAAFRRHQWQSQAAAAAQAQAQQAAYLQQ